jgi:flagellar secretion chaperone FliS
MVAGGTAQYLRNQILTASPEQLQLMLYDGAIRFSRRGRDALAKNDLEESFNHLTRAQRIVLEMLNGLRPEVNPEVCNKMVGLYNFVYRRLVDGSIHKDTQAIDEAIRILEYQRETWTLLMDKLAKERGQAAEPSPVSSVAAELTSSFSVEG